MSPHVVVSSYLPVSPLPLRAVCFLLRLAKDYSHLCFPQQVALSSPDFPLMRGISDRSVLPIYVNELFVTELALDSVVFLVQALDFLAEGRGDVFAMLVALH